MRLPTLPGGRRFGRLFWAIAVAVLAGLAWQGHHLAGLLPELETRIASLGSWGPVVFVVATLLLAPLLVPDTIFGVTAGVVFGLGAGSLYYCASSYTASLLAYFAGRRWLREPVLTALRSRTALWRTAQAARRKGPRLVFWLRLVPMNPAMLSYALGAVDVSFRAVALGTLGMLPHLFLTVYVGVTAAHVTRMAAARHAEWGIEEVGVCVGLVALGAVLFQVTRLARREIAAAEAEVEDPPD